MQKNTKILFSWNKSKLPVRIWNVRQELNTKQAEQKDDEIRLPMEVSEHPEITP
jgi:hypothetical protein